MLELDLRVDIGEAGLSRFDVGRCLRKPRTIVPIVDPEQDITRADSLVVLRPPRQ